ncbi:conserved hypothetical protein [Leishmania infantum JPCM5]|uniref:Uncharacterized protein n=2 Tax=Leishmania infantum TaxID=5671 RepID=A4HWX1_LEIIN|nr:conserved hypothetical protein [Leishmania infantum JPCM5]CAC9475162.1 hypothetical_protein_-_conserved [Leishmania infantum]CAM66955.1 conserved hypothetical protein [Leishmania infantum JPCM5]SUZ40655.1 hypothetical_protein_-_conserved [Leishmania infantum]|eukprot:XP_001464562.1 conserved hypothetical protein [Leishmania infantum JPCM5]
MLRQRLHRARATHRARSHDVCETHGLAALFRRTCAARPCGGLSAVVLACCYASTATSSTATSPPPPYETTSMPKSSPSQPPATARPPRVPPPPPLSLLSWAVDGSGHTHHRCRRRLSMEERIPLVCETIRAAASDVVALQDSTPELAEALINGPDEGIVAKPPRPAPERRFRIYCADLARDLQHQRPSSASPTSSASAAPVAPVTTEAPLNADCHEQQPPTTDAPAHAASSLTLPPASSPSCRYRLVGRARNGRCGEVQLFIKEGSVWDAQLLPGMGAGLTVELRSRTSATLPPHTSKGDASTSDIASSETSNQTSSAARQGGADPVGSEADSPCHRCVLTTLDLSYRGKSLGTNTEGLLADAAVSAEGSPFTLQTQRPSSLSAAKRHGRAPGQLDAHRAMALDWVYHHVRPDVLVGNLFTGAREHVPGFEDTWVRAGSPAGQERTTNTCAQHRVDHATNYFYFQPSRNVASSEAIQRLMRMDEAAATVRRPLPPPPPQPPTTDGALRSAAAAGTTSGKTTETTSTTIVAVAADAPVGTPIPLTASRDSATGSWQLRSSSACGGGFFEGAEHRDGSVAASSAAECRRAAEDGHDDVCTSGDITVGMPEVAGRFQRCLLRRWVRRGPASRSGHLSAHPFLRQYRHCRVVVLRPTVEVELSAAEQAWHTRYITAQYNTQKSAMLTPSATAEGEPGEGAAAAVAASQATRVGEGSFSSPRQARVSSRVRCSVSDQYPLLTLLA